MAAEIGQRGEVDEWRPRIDTHAVLVFLVYVKPASIRERSDVHCVNKFEFPRAAFRPSIQD